MEARTEFYGCRLVFHDSWLVLMVFHGSRLVFPGFRSVFWLLTVPGWFLTNPVWFSGFFTVQNGFSWPEVGFYGSRLVFIIPGWWSCPPGLAGFGLVIMMMIMMRRRIVSFTWAGVGAAQKGVGRGIGQSTDPDRRNSSGSGSGTTTTLATLQLQQRCERVIVGTTLAREQKQILFTPSSLNPDIPHFLWQKKRLCFYKCKYKHKYTTEITEAVSPGPGGQGLHLCGTHQVRRVQRRRGRTLPKAIWTQASTALAALWFGQVWFGVVGLLW